MAKVLLSIEERLLDRVDAECRRLGLTRSAYLARLAAADIGHPSGPGASPEARAAMTRLDELFQSETSGDSTTIIREQRDAR